MCSHRIGARYIGLNTIVCRCCRYSRIVSTSLVGRCSPRSLRAAAPSLWRFLRRDSISWPAIFATRYSRLPRLRTKSTRRFCAHCRVRFVKDHTKFRCSGRLRAATLNVCDFSVWERAECYHFSPMLLQGVPRYLSTAAVANRLSISPRTVRLWAEVGELPALKFGRQWRFDETILLKWLSTRTSTHMAGCRSLAGIATDQQIRMPPPSPK